MARFVLRAPNGTDTDECAADFSTFPNVNVIDKTPQMMLVEASEADAQQFAKQLPGWSVVPEVKYKIPDTRKRIVNSPS